MRRHLIGPSVVLSLLLCTLVGSGAAPPAIADEFDEFRIPEHRLHDWNALVDVLVSLTDGSYHEVDSSERAFFIAGSMAFKEAAQRARPILLEPVMAVEVVVPEDFVGEVMGELNARRGRITGMESRGNTQVVTAQVPLATLFGHATVLRSATQGRATFTMQFDHYEAVSATLAEEILGRRAARA